MNFSTKQKQNAYTKLRQKLKWFYAGLVFLFSISSVLLAEPACATGATLYLSPASGNYAAGSNFSVAVKVNTGGAPINAAEGVLLFDPDYLEVKSIKKGGTFTLWTTEPNVALSAGRISFGGGVPNPGYTGSAGTIIAVTFKARAAGSTQITFASGAVLANDGIGTNILSGKTGGTYTLITEKPAPEPSAPTKDTPPALQIISLTHPDQNQWSNNGNAEFSWTLTPDIMGVSFVFDQNPETIPGNLSDGLFDKKTFQNISEGVWYFHLKLKNKEGWGSATHYKTQIDKTPPLPFEAKILEGNMTKNSQPILLFETRDELSGISHYEIKIGDGDAFTVSSDIALHNPYKMPRQAPGLHLISVYAVDRTGNKQEAKTVLLVQPSLYYKFITKPAGKIKAVFANYFLMFIGLLIILALIIFLAFLLYKEKQKEKKLKKEVKEVREKVDRSFERIKKKTPKEDSKEIESIKKEIQKEIKDVEDEIN